MRYDFDKTVNRRGSGSLKWDVEKRELPMWVADMDFETAPEIKEALMNRVEHGVFGYSILPEEWADAYISWWKRRHGFLMKPEELLFTTGVVPAISSAVRKLTTPGENVLVMTPGYNIFFNSIRNNGRNILENHLLYHGGAYQIDWESLRKQLSDPQTSLMILCNPHNPIGKIWDKKCLKKIGELCSEYSVTVLSDEIHCDLTAPGLHYIPFASVDAVCKDISVTMLAPTKTFNLAGLQTAAVYAANPVLRHKMWRGLNTDEVAEPNAFAVCAAVAAFTRGDSWLEALRTYIEENKQFVTDFLQEHLPDIVPVASQATYLMWLDCRKISMDSDKLSAFIRERSGLYLASGREYGTNGDGFLRLNIATRRALVEDGMKRLLQSIREWEVS